MKGVALFFFVAILYAVNASGVTQLTPTRASLQSHLSVGPFRDCISGKYVVGINYDDYGAQTAFYEVDSTAGVYNLVHNESGLADSCLNNGKWLGGVFQNLDLSYTARLFQLDATHQPINSKNVTLGGNSNLVFTKISQDDTIVVTLLGGFVWVFAFNGSDWNQIQTLQSSPEFGANPPYYPITVYENSLLIFNASNTWQIWTKQADKTYAMTDVYTFNSTYLTDSFNVYYDDQDTVVIAWQSPYYGADVSGYAVFFTRNNDGTWTETLLSAVDLGYTAVLQFGYSTTSIGQDYVLISTLREGNPNNANQGVVTLFKRQGSNWKQYADIRSTDPGNLGTILGVSDEDMVAVLCRSGKSMICDYYTVPLCLLDPLNVTCSTLTVDECSIDFANLTLYTFNNPARCNPTVELSGVTFSATKYVLSANYNFTRTLANPVTCTAEVSCPAPVIPVAPVASQVPVQKTPAKVSSATAMIINSVLFLIFVVAL